MYNLFKQGNIGNLEIPNRIIMAPMLTCYANGPYVSDRLIEFLEARAKGGAGMIITEIACVHPHGQLEHNQIAVYDNKFIPGLRKLADTVHKYGAKIAMQIGHGGRASRSDVIGVQPVSSSSVPLPRSRELPRELTKSEIRGLVESFIYAAVRAKAAGYDGVEVHCAHNYLLRQFISPYSNVRTDEYGGNIKNRVRFPCEIVAGIKNELKNFPVWVRINGDDFVPQGGLTHDESKIVASLFVEAGAEAISVSAGTYDSPKLIWSTPPMYLPPGCNVYMAANIKSVINVPVIAAGRINSPSLAEQILSEGKADFLAIGRALIADPDFPRKAAEGRISEIRKCIADNECIHSLLIKGLVCTVNAAVGKEKEYLIKLAEAPKKVMVIGAGPAGMEAARIATLRGHDVTIFEQQSDLGGQLNLADKPPDKGDISRLTAYYQEEIDRLKIKVYLNKKVTPAVIKKFSPDVVILATGALPVILNIPGAHSANVVTANDVLAGMVLAGKRIAVIGGGRVGVEVADYISNKNKDVTIIEMQKTIGYDLGLTIKGVALSRLNDANVKILTETKAVEIKNHCVVVERQGELMDIEADSIVMAVGSKSNDGLLKNIPKGLIIFSIGDCVKPRNIIDAVAEGAKVGYQI